MGSQGHIQKSLSFSIFVDFVFFIVIGDGIALYLGRTFLDLSLYLYIVG